MSGPELPTAYLIHQHNGELVFLSDKGYRFKPKNDINVKEAKLVTDEFDKEHTICRIHFTDNSKLLSALRGYMYDKNRKERKRLETKQKEADLLKATIEKAMNENIITWGKYNKAKYEDVLLVDKDYCKLVMRRKTAVPAVNKFKEWLTENMKDDDAE
jgi:hypothetical protein